MSLNRFMGIGNLTRDVEVRQVGQNNVARYAIAMNEKFKKQDGSIGESTEYLEVEYWGNSGVFQYLLKGQQVFVEGSIRTETWTGNDGIEKKAVKLRAREVQLLGSRQQAPAQPQYQQQPQRPAYPPQQAPGRPVPPPRPQAPAPQRPPMPQQPVPQFQQPAYPQPQYPQYPQEAPEADMPADVFSVPQNNDQYNDGLPF